MITIVCIICEVIDYFLFHNILLTYTAFFIVPVHRQATVIKMIKDSMKIEARHVKRYFFHIIYALNNITIYEYI